MVVTEEADARQADEASFVQVAQPAAADMDSEEGAEPAVGDMDSEEAADAAEQSERKPADDEDSKCPNNRRASIASIHGEPYVRV